MRLGWPLFLCLLAGCGGAAMPPKVMSSMRASSLPGVVACWEHEVEQADFSGSYVATLDFTIEAETSKIRGARVVKLDRSSDATGDSDGSAFRSCLETALNQSQLPVAKSESGTGFRETSDVVVTGYRLAFVDASSEQRRSANRRVSHVLLGPRSDRCQGLYAHDPPLDASVLFAAIAEAERRADAYGESDLDAFAREQQKAYDTALELVARLRDEEVDPLIPEANRQRVQKALADATALVEKLAPRIGCKPPKKR